MSDELDLDEIERQVAVGYWRPGCTVVLEIALDDTRALLAEVRRLRVERDELRAVLAPLLDDAGEIGAPCLFCGVVVDTSPHAPDCPVLHRDRLLGRMS